MSSADGLERGQKPKAHKVGLGFVRDGGKPRVANRRSVTRKKRGVLYGLLETLWRGHTHWTMMVLAAAICIPLDLATEHFPWTLPLPVQAVLGGLAITAGELLAGLVLNVWLGLGIWDYSGQWGNLWGQICPLYTLLWCLLAGPVIVAFDWLDHWLCGGERPQYRLFCGECKNRP